MTNRRDKLKILSLFDGMACGMLAMQKANIKVDEYIAYEIDKYAIQTATHNFPMIKECGDVFKADFTQYKDIDYIIGGSPCTYWSIAQKNNRETEASGLGWELFSQYVRALKETKPKFFIYENNKSMSNAIRESIAKTFGFEPICINSALVSAQNRQRLYWVGKRNADGTYSKVDVKQPKDKGILIKDILKGGTDLTTNNKSWALTASYNGAVPWNTIEKCQRNMVAEPVIFNVPHGFNKGGIKYDKSPTLTANGWQSNNFISEPVNITSDGKSHTIKAQYNKNGMTNFVTNGGHVATAVAEPVCMGYERSEEAKRLRKQYENGEVHHGFHELSELHPRTDGKTNTLSTVLKDNPICEPVRVGSMPRPNGELSESQGFRIYSTEGKSVGLKENAGGSGGKTGLYAIPVAFDSDKPTKAISCTDRKTYTVYEVRDGQIEIKGKEYPIKFPNGYYIIRKLTVSECKRLQTVSESYEFPVSDSQAYKMLGNGWTVDVIAHIIKEIQNI